MKRIRATRTLYLHSFKTIQFGDKVIICCRVSNRGRPHSLHSQLAKLYWKVAKRGAIVIDVHFYEGNGADPWWLEKPAALAKQKGATLLAFSTSRFIRHPDYDAKTQPHLQARTVDLEKLRSITKGVPLVTFIHPDTPPGEEHSQLTLLGTGKPIGALQHRRTFRPLVMALHADGISGRRISKLVGRPSSTVHDWLNR